MGIPSILGIRRFSVLEKRGDFRIRYEGRLSEFREREREEEREQ